MIISTLIGAVIGSVILSQEASGQSVIRNWTIQSSNKIKDSGSKISLNNYNDANWYSAKDASTVLAALVTNGIYNDPYYGTNLAKIPGYRTGAWQTLDMPDDSPFNTHWWYRSEFKLSESYSKKNAYLLVHGINYKANIWINGDLIADTNKVEGPYRTFKLDITKYVRAGKINTVAFEIVPPKGTDPSIRWMQGTRTPPDRDTGIWYDAKVLASGPIHLKNSYVETDLNLSSTATASLTISDTVKNKTNHRIKGSIHGTISYINNLNQGGTSKGNAKEITFSQDIQLQAGESLRLSKHLKITDPHLWWPVDVGRQNLYELTLEVKTDSGITSDRDTVQFGVREVSTSIENNNGHRIVVFKVNGKRILVRGGDWTETMMMETTPKREEIAIRYAKNMHLNTLRLEGFWGSDHFFRMADKYGIMIFNGLNCCSIWERWGQWTKHTANIAVASLRDQVVRLRNHPSLVQWVLGSDRYPPREIEARYVDVLKTYDSGIPYIPVMPNRTSNIYGYAGYSSRPDRHAYPSEWYKEMEGFNWESGGVGAEQIAPIESMRSMMPKHDLWPISGSWNIRLWQAGTTDYPASRQAFYDRYGQPGGVAGYSMRSQPWQYESNRAVYEAAGKKKYLTSGNLKYRYNAGWPSLSFQLYDYYYRPNGAFYGTQKASEPLHVLYAYDDQSVYAVNSYYQSFTDLQVKTTVYSFDMVKKYQNTETINIGPDATKKVLQIPNIDNLPGIYFVYMEMKDTDGKQISRNFYWLSSEGDVNADFSGLSALSPVDLDVNAKFKPNGRNSRIHVTVKNPSDELGYFINPTVIKGLHGTEVLPVYWSTNYFSLLPDQKLSVTATFDEKELRGKEPHLMIEGFNIKPKEYSLTKINKEVTSKLKYSEFFAPTHIGSGRSFEVSVKVKNSGNVGKGVLKARQFLYIDGESRGFKRIALAPGESKKLIWPYVNISKPGEHKVTIGSAPPAIVEVDQEDHFWPLQEEK